MYELFFVFTHSGMAEARGGSVLELPWRLGIIKSVVC